MIIIFSIKRKSKGKIKNLRVILIISSIINRETRSTTSKVWINFYPLIIWSPLIARIIKIIYIISFTYLAKMSGLRADYATIVSNVTPLEVY